MRLDIGQEDRDRLYIYIYVDAQMPVGNANPPVVHIYIGGNARALKRQYISIYVYI